MVQLPGGHLEFGESFEECARREVMEETGLEIEKLRFATATNDIFEAENKHYITIFIVARTKDADPKPLLLEPNKCDGWEFVSWDWLLSAEKANLFVPLRNLIATRPDFRL